MGTNQLSKNNEATALSGLMEVSGQNSLDNLSMLEGSQPRVHWVSNTAMYTLCSTLLAQVCH